MSQKWNNNIQFPNDSNFVNRIIGATFGPSNNSGNPMVTITTEVVSPQDVEIGGPVFNIAGVETTNYYSVKDLADEANTAKKQADFIERVWSKLELDPAQINWDNIDTKPLLGKLILTRMYGEPQVRRKNPTAAQLEAAKVKGEKFTQGDIMKHPVTGKELITYKPVLAEIFGLAPNQGEVGVPY